MKDHEKAQLINALRDCAIKYHATQQLRSQIAKLVLDALDKDEAPAVLPSISKDNDSYHQWYP